MLLMLLVFTLCSNRMLLLVLLEKFKCPYKVEAFLDRK